MGMFGGLLVLALLCAFCVCVSAVSNYDAAALPLPAICGCVVVLYVFGLVGILPWGLFAAIGLLLAGTAYFGVRAGARAVKRALFSPGLLLFFFGAAFIWLLFAVRQPLFTQWDEFTAWGLAPKMLKERNAFYVANPINLTASFTYPATSLVSYLFQALSPDFTEWQCLAALDILALACLAPAAALPRKSWAKAVAVMAAAVLLPFFFSAVPTGTPSTVYANAMADTPLAMLFGGTLCLYYAIGGRKSGFVLALLPIAVVAMVKDIGFAYGLMAAFLIGIDLLFAAPRPAAQRRSKTLGLSLAKAGGLAAAVVAVFAGWNAYTAAVTPTADTAASVGNGGLSYPQVLLGGIKQLLGIGRDDRFAEIMRSMGSALLTRRVCLVGAPVRAIICILIVAALAWLVSKKGAPRRRVLALALAGAFCFAALYLFHLILYYYNFAATEGLALKDYERYISPYLLGWLLAMLCLLARAAAQAEGASARVGAAAMAGVCVCAAAIFAWRGVPTAAFWSDAASLYTLRNDVKNRAAPMNDVLDWDDRVLVISQGDDATRWYYYKYELTAKVVDGYGGIWWGNDDLTHRWDSDFMNLVESLNWQIYDYEAVCTVQSLAAYMEEKDCDYLLIDRADDYLERDFSERFEGGLTADMAATLYKFTGSENTVCFIPVAMAESGVAQ